MAEQEIINLGIVGISNKGQYNSETDYEKLNVVTYNGSSYCALRSCKGIVPTNTDYWQLYAEKGATGATGEQGPIPIKGVDYFTTADKLEIENDLSSTIHDAISDQLGSLVSATPLAVSSVSEMQDTSRIYVNNTDGNWYYYANSQWNIGGIYLATDFDVTALRGIFTKKLKLNSTFTKGGYNSSTGAETTTISRFKNPSHFRNNFLVRLNDDNYGIDIHFYNYNSDYTIEHINNDVIKVEDNNFHYINKQNADFCRLVVVDLNSAEISEDDYETVWNKIEFYVIPNNENDELYCYPEEYFLGGIYGPANTTQLNIGDRYYGDVSYKFSHFTRPPKFFEEDTIVKIKFKKDVDKPIHFGFNIYVFNQDKYLIGYKGAINKDITLLINANNYFSYCAYKSGSTRFPIKNIDDYFEVETTPYKSNIKNYYKIPCLSLSKLFLQDSPSNSFAIQSITSDNDYLYTGGLVNLSDNRAVVSKISFANKTIITRSQEKPFNHINGMGYNSNNNKIVIGGLDTKIRIINPETFELTNEISLDTILNNNNIIFDHISSIAYNENFNIYCVYCFKNVNTYSERMFILLDENFNYIKEIKVISPRNVSLPTTGGCFLFDNMITLVNHGVLDGNPINRLLYYNWKGELISYIDVSIDLEIEGLTIKDDIYYLGFNRQGYNGYNIYALKPILYRLLSNDDLANDFVNINNIEQSNINVDSYTNVYDDIDNIENNSHPADWF